MAPRPMDTLPPELIIEIFTRFLPPYPACAPLLGPGSPASLLLVCRRWRDIVLSAPSLWRAFDTTLDYGRINTTPIRRALERSQSLPLSIYVGPSPGSTTPEADEFLTPELAEAANLTLAHITRWEYVRWHLPEPDEDMHDRCSFLPNPIEGSIPLLRELDIDVPTDERYIGPDPVHAPLLRKLVVHLHQGGRFFPLFSRTSWNNLTALKLGYIALDDAARILRCTPNLVHSWLIFWGDPADEDTSQLSPSQPIRLPHLRTLILELAEPRSLIDFLRILVLPSLQRLALKEAFLWQLLPHPITLEQMDILASVLLDTLHRWECPVDALTHIQIMGRSREVEDAYRAAFTNETVLNFGDPPGFTFESTPYWPIS